MTWSESRVDAGLPSRLLAFSLVTLGEGAVLSVLGVEPGLTLAWGLISAGVVAVLERDLARLLLPRLFGKRELAKARRKKQPSPAYSLTEESAGADGNQPAPVLPAESELERNQKPFYHARMALELLLPLLLAVLTLLGSGRLTRITHTDGRNCAACCTPPDCQNGPPPNPQGETTLRISPSLEQAMEKFFSRDDHGTSQGPLNTLLLLAIVAGIAFVAFAVRKHPSTAAPLSAAGVAVAAMKSDHLSHLDSIGSHVFLGGFITVIAIIFVSTLQGFRLNDLVGLPARDVAKGNGEGSGKVVESPLNTMLSLAILLWTGLVLCYYQPEKRVDNPPPPPPPPPPLSGKLEYKLLKPIPGFSPFRSALPQVGDPVAALAQEIGPQQSGRLLLLGSADCTAIRSKGITNVQLAEDRANAVKTALTQRKLTGNLRIDGVSLHQHDRCRESSDLRAVFPVLIQPAANQP